MFLGVFNLSPNITLRVTSLGILLKGIQYRGSMLPRSSVYFFARLSSQYGR